MTGSRQVPALGKAVRPHLGCDHRQHQRRNTWRLTLPTLPWLCNQCHLPIGTAGSVRADEWQCGTAQLSYNGRTYHFCSRPCRQILWEDRDTLYDPTVVERLLGGEDPAPDVDGILG